VIIMDRTRVAKKTFEECKRRAGRPRLRWLEDAENDLRQLKMKTWR
jgi:hypothetical protein